MSSSQGHRQHQRWGHRVDPKQNLHTPQCAQPHSLEALRAAFPLRFAAAQTRHASGIRHSAFEMK